jgi:hypothetical protein
VQGDDRKRTSRDEECSMRMFLAVMMCTSMPVSMCRISIKLGSKAKMYGLKMPKACGVPSHVIIQSDRARQPLRFTKKL